MESAATESSLVDSFLAALPSSLRDATRSEPGADAELAARLAEAWRAARVAFPAITVETDVFAAHLGARAPADAADAIAALALLRTDDLYLACACARGDREALAAFDARYAADVDTVVARLTGAKERVDDVVQIVRTKLFVASERPPAILQYAGRSSLRTWFNATVTRVVLDEIDGDRRSVPVDDELFAALPDGGIEPELAYLRELYATELRQALASVLAGLDVRQRNLLRYAFVDGLTIDQIGTLHRVHRATAARWVQEARALVLQRLRQTMMKELRVNARELESVLRVFESGVDVSLRRFLADAG